MSSNQLQIPKPHNAVYGNKRATVSSPDLSLKLDLSSPSLVAQNNLNASEKQSITWSKENSEFHKLFPKVELKEMFIEVRIWLTGSIIPVRWPKKSWFRDGCGYLSITFALEVGETTLWCFHSTILLTLLERMLQLLFQIRSRFLRRPTSTSLPVC